MKSNIPAYLTLEEVISTYISERGHSGMMGYERLFDLAVRWLINDSLHNSVMIKTVSLTPQSSMNHVTLPQDYVGYVTVGMKFNERIYILAENPNIALPEYECGAETRDTDLSNDNIYTFTPYGDTVYYGLRGGYEDVYFKIDKKNRILLLEGVIPSGYDIILEYQSSGIDYEGTTVVPLEDTEVLIAYLRHMDTLNDSTVSLGQKDLNIKLYIAAKQERTQFQYPISMKNIKSAIYRSTSQAVKR